MLRDALSIIRVMLIMLRTFSRVSVKDAQSSSAGSKPEYTFTVLKNVGHEIVPNAFRI